KEEFNNAVTFYEGLRNKNKGTLFGYTASNMAVQAYMFLERYEDAGRVMEETIADYPITLTFAQQFPLIESIYIKALNRPEKAINIYRSIIETTEDERIEGFLHDKIGELLDEE
ncbi:hypothetical protein OAA99_01930, partial [Omnitrophica bacterium]|nr:hypothetical protein [Candidatus Omnitrophota bacterium]